MSEIVRCDRCGGEGRPGDLELWIRCEPKETGSTYAPIISVDGVDLCSLDCAAQYFVEKEKAKPPLRYK